MISVKVHETEKGIVVGACDAELLGKVLEEDDLILELSREFYFERHAKSEDVLPLLEGCMTANLVGERIVNAYCEENPGAESAIISVGGVPHLQIFRL